MCHTTDRTPARCPLRRPGPLVVAALTALTVRSLRTGYLRWGATDDEVRSPLPGDDLLTAPHLSATRAITVDATADQVWPWIAQLGQGRGGFYSYDRLENLVGCDIHSADRIVEDWLVLHGGLPDARAGTPPYDFTWSFVLRDAPDGTTRLVVRERYKYAHRWAAAMVEPVELVSFVMSRRMMRGIKQRSERAAEAT